MICVSIGRGRHRHVIAEHKHLVEQGAALVELRLDYINGQVNLKRLLPERPGPVIITLRRPQDGGKYSGSEEERRMLLRTAIAEGVEYVDLEEDAAAVIPRYGKTKRIISLHDFRKTPENLEEIHARLAALDADIVKLATLANHPHDNLRMLKLVQNAKTPTVGLCMGDIGVPSRVLSGRYGAPFTYATFHHERALAPGQLSFDASAGELRTLFLDVYRRNGQALRINCRVHYGTLIRFAVLTGVTCCGDNRNARCISMLDSIVEYTISRFGAPQ